MHPTTFINAIVAIVLIFSSNTRSQTITQFGPDGFIRIEEGSGGFFADLDSGDRFSRDHDVAGDINGDGILDLVVGARSDDDGQRDAGAVYILFMNNDGTVASNQKISMLEGGFDETLEQGNFFGYGVAGIGDYDNDDIPDIAVSAPSSTNRALYIIHLNSDGTIKDYVKNTGIIAQGLSAVGDLNHDGKIDLVACDPNSDDGGTNRGAISILFFDEASRVVPGSTVTISSTSGGLGDGLENRDMFGGREVAILGDIDNDGTLEMAVGAFMSDSGKGAVWILSLDSTNFNVVLNGDGVPDLITGANQQGTGDLYILYLNNDKTVKTYTKIDEFEGGFNLDFDVGAQERFSRSISFIGDLRGDGTIAVNVGGGVGQAGTGTLYLLFFQPCDFTEAPGLNHWSGGNTLFTNWNHSMQMLTSDSLTLEQCTFKAFETDAPYMTYNFNDGRCICKDSTAVLTPSTELSTAFSNECSDGLLSTNTDEFATGDQSVNIFPNPTVADVLLTTSQTSFSLNDRITIYDAMGSLLYTSTIGGQQTTIDFSRYPVGMYFLRTSINGRSRVFKVIKE